MATFVTNISLHLENIDKNMMFNIRNKKFIINIFAGCLTERFKFIIPIFTESINEFNKTIVEQFKYGQQN
jgi:hypothetical protein